MAKYPFLSDEWLGEARRIYAAADLSGPLAAEEAPASVRVNLVVTDVPFSAAPLDAHVDTSGGRLAIDTGHLPGADVTVSLDYATARSLFVAGDAQSVMQAFLAGRIKVDGDLSKLLDPRSGLWAGGGAMARPAPAGGGSQAPLGSPGPPGPPGGSGTPAAYGAARLGLGLPDALETAVRLQEITE